MGTDTVEVAVRGVRLPAHEALPALVMVGPCNRSSGPYLVVRVGSGEAHALHHELDGRETLRSQAVDLVGRVVSALGGRLVAARLVQVRAGTVTATLELATPSGRVEVRAEPGQALAAAVKIGVPLLADGRLFHEARSAAPIDGPLASFLESLDLGGLGDPAR